jgi:UDP-N-acetylmuramoylalanine--D-glutamate ligase
MKNYINCKYKIFRNQTENDFLLLNADDETLMKEKQKTKAQIFYFSTKKQVCKWILMLFSIFF